MRRVWNVTVMVGVQPNVLIEDNRLLEKNLTAEQAFAGDTPSMGNDYDCFWIDKNTVAWGPSHHEDVPLIVVSCLVLCVNGLMFIAFSWLTCYLFEKNRTLKKANAVENEKKKA